MAALTQEFQPSIFKDKDWAIHEERSVGDLLDEALDRLKENPGDVSSAAIELCARSLGGLASLGLVYSDQGSQAKGEAWLRGSVGGVLAKLVVCAGGLKILCEAAERAEDAEKLMPCLYTADGDPVFDEGGNQIHLHPDQDANICLRELAFRDARPTQDDEDADEGLSPYDSFIAAQGRAVAVVDQLEEMVNEILEIQDDDAQALVDKHGLDRTVMGKLPSRMDEIRDLVLLSLAEDDSSDSDGVEHDPGELKAMEEALMAGTAEPEG